MNLITNLLKDENIVLDLEANSKELIFKEISELFEANQGLAKGVVFDSLMAREKLCSTGLGQGIAIPHERIKGLRQAYGAFIRLSVPVDFGSPDGKPVSILFVLLFPEQGTEEHLQILSKLAEVFSIRACREALLTVDSVADIRRVFEHE